MYVVLAVLVVIRMSSSFLPLYVDNKSGSDVFFIDADGSNSEDSDDNKSVKSARSRLEFASPRSDHLNSPR